MAEKPCGLRKQIVCEAVYFFHFGNKLTFPGVSLIGKEKEFNHETLL